MNQVTPAQKAYDIVEAVIARGDLAELTPKERGKYYSRLCASIGLNPYTRPFEYLMLSNKLVLYARKDATDQLRAIHGISVTEMTEREREGVCIVTAHVRNAAGRTDVSTGAVSIAGKKGDDLANAMMKAETKAKRRATLSICGLGFLDETELETISGATRGGSVPSARDELEYADPPATPEAPPKDLSPVGDMVPDLPTQRYQAEET